jgi:hypothetical protein
MDISFEGQYDKRMFRQALGLVQRQSAFSRISRWLAMFLALLVIGYWLYTWATTGVFEVARLTRHLITAVLLGYYCISPYFSQWAAVNSLFANTNLRTMHGHVNTQGVFISSPNSQAEATFEWKRFFRKGKKDELISLFTMDGTLAVFHSNFFACESDWHQFEQLVDQKIKEIK